MKPETALKLAVLAQRVLSKTWHPKLPESIKSQLDDAIRESRLLAEMIGSHDCDWEYSEEDMNHFTLLLSIRGNALNKENSQ